MLEDILFRGGGRVRRPAGPWGIESIIIICMYIIILCYSAVRGLPSGGVELFTGTLALLPVYTSANVFDNPYANAR